MIALTEINITYISIQPYEQVLDVQLRKTFFSFSSLINLIKILNEKEA